MTEKEINYKKTVENFEITYDGIDHIFLNNNSDKLLITFAAFNSGNRYSCINSHAQLKEYDLLFLKDSNSDYYLCDNIAKYDFLYKKYTDKYSPRNIVVWGSSMGGYAALRLALSRGFQAFVNCPQIQLDCSIEYAWPALSNKLKSIWNFKDITDLHISDNDIHLYYTYGDHLLDVANTTVFKYFISQHKNVHPQFKRYVSDKHTIFPSFNDFKIFLNKIYNT